MNACSFDIKDMLVADSALGLVYASNLFIGKEPATPNNCVTIFDSVGFKPQLTLDNQRYEYPSVQIRVRNSNYLDGWDMIEKIKTSLHGRAQETWNETLYSVIYCFISPTFLRWDENNRAQFVSTYNINRR
jgi:hypothetical protein